MAQAPGLSEPIDAQNPLSLEMGAPDSYWRDNLGEYIDRQIERQLARLGAEPRQVHGSGGFDEAVEDLLCRVDGLGHDSVTLRFADLSGIATDGALSLADSVVLRRWFELEPLMPLNLQLPSSAWSLRAYPAPVPLRELSPSQVDRRAPSGFSPLHGSRTTEAGPDSGTHVVPPRPPALDGLPPTPRAPMAGAKVPPLPFAFDDDEFEEIIAASRRPRPSSSKPVTAEAVDCADSQAQAIDAQTSDAEAILFESADDESIHVEAAQSTAEGGTAEPDAERQSELDLDAGLVETIGVGVYHTEEKSHIRRWRETLEAASGNQSWDDLERLFLASYLPLSHAAAEGEADERSVKALDGWARGFDECYRAAFGRLRNGGHRPTMICDLPQLAFQTAREHHAPHTRLILVDGMRFDLGQRVHDKLRMQLTRFAHCVARGVSWAALPSTTAAQLELLARGPTALRNLAGDLDERQWVAGPSTARRLRPLRVGGHNVLKLDIVEAEFHGVDWYGEELGKAAAEVAVSVGRYIKQQEPGTLVVVFGDHGSPSVGKATPGTRPEEVLVPYDMWLVGDLD